jgi:PPP family 3-phenylpropionic acid transporter
MRLTWLAALYGTLFFELGVNLPFFPVWLRARALDDGAIGIVLAVPLVARIFANPLVTLIADRVAGPARTLVACAASVGVATALLAGVEGFGPILALVGLIGLAQGPLIALTDSITLHVVAGRADPERLYGMIRLWGSLAISAANLCAGAAVDRFSPVAIIVLLAGSALATAGAAAAAARRLPAPALNGPSPAGRARRPAVLALVIAGAALVQASHAVLYAFASLHWQAQGLDGVAIGALWALGVLAEILVFAFAGRVACGQRGGAALVLAGGTTAVLRWTAMASDPAGASLAGLQLLHGLSFGATHLGSVFLLHRLSPEGLRAQAQGWLAATWAGVMALLTSVSGALYPTWGEASYGLMALVAALGLALLATATLALRRPVSA